MERRFSNFFTLILTVMMLFSVAAVSTVTVFAAEEVTGVHEEIQSIKITSLTVVKDGVLARWETAENAVKYELFAVKQEKTAKIYEGSATSFTDKTLQNGKVGSYFVKAFDKDNTCIAVSETKKITYYSPAAAPNVQVVKNGISLTWKNANVSSYRIFRKAKDEASFKKLADVSDISYTDTSAVTGKVYSYAIQYLDSNKKALNLQGSSTEIAFVKAPSIGSLQNSFGAVTVKWSKVSGTSKYFLYKKTGSGSFVKTAQTTSASYTDKAVKDGTVYAYVIKCVDKNGRFISYYGTQKSIKYIKAPKITKISNTKSGSTITWEKIGGAAKYQVYVLNGGNWKSLGSTTKTNFTHSGLKNNTTYTYTVKCLDSKGKALSGFDPKGTNNLFLSPIAISSVSNSNKANVIKWKKVNTAVSYTVYRKALGESRKKLAGVKTTSYTDKTAKSGIAYQYTVVALNKGAKAVTYFNDSEKYYSNGKLANGVFTYGDTKQNFKNGVPAEKIKVLSKTIYCYNSKGELQKGGIVGSSAVGYYYADKNGKVNRNYCGAIKQKDKQWNVICGKASKVSTEKDKTLYRALAIVAKITTVNMTKEQKLQKCFDYVKTYKEFNPRIPHYHGNDWTVVYANDMFVGKGGNCFSFAAAFAFMAKGIGYTNIIVCNSGGHGWTEINGLVYDPERSLHDNRTTYFGISYSTGPVAHYKKAVSDGTAWKRVKI